MLAVPLARLEVQLVASVLTHQVVLGQRRALVREFVFRADQDKRAAVPFLTQGLGGACAGQARADDHHAVLIAHGHFPFQTCTPARAKNSARDRASVRRLPSSAEVTVVEPVARTPRSVMHECSASSTTPAPRGRSRSTRQSATCLVRRSCVCGRAAKCSTRRASLDRPRMRSAGRYPTCATPENGSKWCSQTVRNGMARAITSSSYPSALSNVVSRTGGGSKSSA